jgi:phosphoglycerol transferase MdoB-like AlkP superfamily enzyme
MASFVALSLFFLTRLTLLTISWQDAVPNLSDLFKMLTIGLLFDSGFIVYALCLPVLYLWLVPQRVWQNRWHGYWLRGLVFSAIYAACFVAVAEFLFWDEFRVRFNFIAVDYLLYRREVTDNILQSYPIVPIFALLFGITLLLYQPCRPWISKALASREAFSRRSLMIGVFLLLPVAAFLILNQPLRQISENTYVSELASNGPYQFIAAFRNNELDFSQFYSRLPEVVADGLLRRELAEPGTRFLSQEMFDIRRDIVHDGPEKRLNVILVTVESLSSDFLGYFGNNQQLTPNLDGLIAKSLFFDNFYATGTRTTRGLEAITLSIPPTPGHSIIKRMGRESDQWSLGDVLNDKGYRSYFAYGGRSFFENMNSFFSGNGYQLIDQATVPDAEIHFTNAWGMADEDLYSQVLKTADQDNQRRQPFFIHVMTTSNHRPYTYPEGRIDIPSGTGRDGAVKYSDYAIGEFLRQAQEQPWFADTVFVIVADHQAGSAGKRTLPLERYHIPLWIYAPAHLAPQIFSGLSSQIDLAPTLLGLLNMSYRSCFFGQDILRTPPNRAFIANYQDLGLFDGRQMAILAPQQRVLLQQGFKDDQVSERPAGIEDSLVQRDISYYQGAAHVYRNRINSWAGRNSFSPFTVAATPAGRFISKKPRNGDGI